MVYKVLVSGQSNALGHDDGGPTVSENVTVWNNVNPLGSNGSAFIAPVLGTDPFRSDGSNNAGLWFCHRLAEETGEAVQLTIVARDSRPIEDWITSDDLSATMSDEVIAVWAATGQAAADFFIWQQGEANDTDTYSQYEAKFLEMVSILTTANVINGDTIIIIGGLSEAHSGWDTFNTSVLELLTTNQNYYYADSENVEHAPSDTSHFSGAGLYQMGYERMWKAIAGEYMIDPIFEESDAYLATSSGAIDATYSIAKIMQRKDGNMVDAWVRLETSDCNISAAAEVRLKGFLYTAKNVTNYIQYPISLGYVDNFGSTNTPDRGIMVENTDYCIFYKHQNSDARSEIAQTLVETDLVDGTGKNRFIFHVRYPTDA